MHEHSRRLAHQTPSTELSAEATACCTPGEGSCVANASCAIVASESALLGGNLTPARKIRRLHADKCWHLSVQRLVFTDGSHQGVQPQSGVS